MQLIDIPFGVTDWSSLAATVHPGLSGSAQWRTQHFGEIRVRRVD